MVVAIHFFGEFLERSGVALDLNQSVARLRRNLLRPAAERLVRWLGVEDRVAEAASQTAHILRFLGGGCRHLGRRNVSDIWSQLWNLMVAEAVSVLKLLHPIYLLNLRDLCPVLAVLG